MTKHTDKKVLDRRSFLRGAGVTAGAAATATLVTGKAAEAAVEPRKSKASAGYQETEHVRQAYDLSRF